MPDGPRAVGAAIAGLSDELTAAGIESAAVDARMLVLAAAGLDRLAALRDPDVRLDPSAEARLAAYCQRRLAREPVSRILGHRAFWSLDFEVTPDVLDPRPDTETLVETALTFLNRAGLDRKPIRILDLGTGSGAILVSLLHELPAAFGVGVDRSAEALEVARRNAERNGVCPRSAWVHGDWCEALAGPFDLIVSNPPYLTTAEIGGAQPEVCDHDPRLSLDGGSDGLAAYRAIVAGWQRLGSPPLLLEIGATQADQVTDLLGRLTLRSPPMEITIVPDLAGKERVVAALPQLRFL